MTVLHGLAVAGGEDHVLRVHELLLLDVLLDGLDDVLRPIAEAALLACQRVDEMWVSRMVMTSDEQGP